MQHAPDLLSPERRFHAVKLRTLTDHVAPISTSHTVAWATPAIDALSRKRREPGDLSVGGRAEGAPGAGTLRGGSELAELDRLARSMATSLVESGAHVLPRTAGRVRLGRALHASEVVHSIASKAHCRRVTGARLIRR